MIVINDSLRCPLTSTCIQSAPHHRSTFMHAPLLQGSEGAGSPRSAHIHNHTVGPGEHINFPLFSHVPRRNKTPLAATRRKANPFKNGDHPSSDYVEWRLVGGGPPKTPVFKTIFFCKNVGRIGTQRPPTRLPPDPLDPPYSQTTAGSPKSQDSLSIPQELLEKEPCCYEMPTFHGCMRVK